MDTSKKYIKMCEKAVEIQKEWKPVFGDYYIFKNEIEIFLNGWTAGTKVFWFNHTNYNKWEEKRTVNNTTWLPRQDQLQGMVFEKEDANASGLIERFNNVLATWAECGYGDNKADPSNFSMEQLWLVFVMKEKYNKVWDGKDWEKIL